MITLVLSLGIVMAGAYAMGRIHQWYRYGVEREEAYRSGYDKASLSLMGLMMTQPPRQRAATEHPGSGRRVINERAAARYGVPSGQQ